jgi:hypothetical protein
MTSEINRFPTFGCKCGDDMGKNNRLFLKLSKGQAEKNQTAINQFTEAKKPSLTLDEIPNVIQQLIPHLSNKSYVLITKMLLMGWCLCDILSIQISGCNNVRRGIEDWRRPLGYFLAT